MKFSGDISFARCFGHGVLFISIDIDNFEFRQHRVYLLNWWNCGSCFKLSDSVKIYDVFSDAFHYLRQKGTITVTFDEKYNTYALQFCLDGHYDETIRLWPYGLRLPSPSNCSETNSEDKNDDSNSLTTFIEKIKNVEWISKTWVFLNCYKICGNIGNGKETAFNGVY